MGYSEKWSSAGSVIAMLGYKFLITEKKS
jgi:hypothetical protein